MDAADVYAYMQRLGFSPGQVDFALRRLLSKNLIEIPAKLRDTGDDKSAIERISHYRITSVGAYYVRRLVAEFAYADAMAVDTPIVDRTFRGRIEDCSEITDRLARAQVFVDYLDSQWAELADQESAFEWPVIRDLIEADIAKIVYRVATRNDQPRHN